MSVGQRCGMVSEEKSHKDTDARWTKKGGQKHYGYKNHAKVDAKSKLIKKAVTTSAEQHDSVPTKLLIDNDDRGQELYADSAYIGKSVKSVMRKYQMKDRVIGFARNAARNALTNLVYNVCRYEQIVRLGMN